MNPELPESAVEFGAAAAKAFAALGNVDAARRAEDKPELRASEVAPLLAALGIEELDPRADEESRGAAAALCEAAGRVALPYPVVGVLLHDDGVPFTPSRRTDHGDLFPRWHVAGVGPAEPEGSPLATRLGPFVTDLTTPPSRSGVATGGFSTPGDPRTAVWLTLTAWQILGTVDRAVELAVDHVTTRIQFGKPLSAFQAVQFQLADAAVAAAGLRELALFTLWRLERPDEALTDALALRVHALDVARQVLRTTQQLHGAAGVCDEYDISVLCRHVQPALRLPFGSERTLEQLASAVDRHGFDGLFPHGR